jgi:hypothetical protein
MDLRRNRTRGTVRRLLDKAGNTMLVIVLVAGALSLLALVFDVLSWMFS